MYNVNDMKNTLKEAAKILLTAAVLAFLLIKFVLIPCVVDGASMYPILENNDFGYSFVLSRNLGIGRFDIAVISIDNGSNRKLLVKRVVAELTARPPVKRVVMELTAKPTVKRAVAELTAKPTIKTVESGL